jgi:ABC-type antimicrobial peptide transport system permease subunit
MASPFLPFRYTWRNVLARKASTAVTLAGVAVSVMAYVVITATAAGIARVAVGTGDPRNLIVLSEGATSVEGSRITRPAVEAIRYFAGVARDASGQPLASPELLGNEAIPRRGTKAGEGDMRFTSVRGVTPMALAVHDGVRVSAGRWPSAPGEVMIGRLLGPALGGVGIGDTLELDSGPHRVVGVFEARGQIFEGEVWIDLEQRAAALAQREVSAVVIRVANPQALPAVIEALKTERRVKAAVRPEISYYADVQKSAVAFVYLGNLIGALLGLGAVVAGTNTTYAAMARRVREMGTLRALGFGRRSVGAVLLVESVLVGAAGGALGAALAFAFDGYALSLMGLAFELDVTRAALARGLVLALAIGVLGALLPARAASRLEIVEALRRA